MSPDRHPSRQPRAVYVRRRLTAFGVLGAVVVALIVAFDTPGNEPEAKSEASATRTATTTETAAQPVDPYASMRASGKAKRVLAVARKQLGVKYVYGAQPRDPDGLHAIGAARYPGGFDCSSFIAYVFEAGIDQWVSGSVAHTDQLWTQGGAMPLDSTADSTSTVIRGMTTRRPPGGYRPGDLLFTRSGAGGYWGHVLMVSERGLVIQSYPPDVYETDHLTKFLDMPAGEVGWLRVKSLSA